MKRTLAFLAPILVLGSAQLLITDNYLLPKDVIPVHYNITIDSYLNKPFFNGSVRIFVDVKNTRNTITFHKANLDILNVTVSSNSVIAKVEDQAYDEKLQLYTLRFSQDLKAQQYLIDITYRGNITTHPSTRGLFIHNYTELYEYMTQVAVTQFQVMDARRVFPCFDEPYLKASFTIKLIRSAHYSTISNMPLKETERIDDCRFRDTFETTPNISTYLVTFAICDFPYLTYSLGRIYIRPPYITLAKHIVPIVETILQEMTQYLQMKLPVEQLNMIAVSPLTREALNNWGLIVFSEQDIMYKDMMYPRENIQNSYSRIAHGIAYQWFGSLVTPHWWNYMWINEGLAEVLTTKIVQKIRPQWRFEEQMALSALIEAVKHDQYYSNTYLLRFIEDMENYQRMFDTMNKHKAAILIRTLQNSIGDKYFIESLKLYVSKHQYSTATLDDLLDTIAHTLEAVSRKFYESYLLRKNIREMITDWAGQPGIPLLYVNRSGDIDNKWFELSQIRYHTKSTIKDVEPFQWCIPINFATKSNPDFTNLNVTHWLLDIDGSIQVDKSILPEEWYIINKEISYYYLVNYEQRNWKLLASALDTHNHDKIPPLTRAKLIFDAFSLANSGYLNYTVALDLIKYLKRETDYIVLKSFFEVFETFYNRFSELDNFHYLQDFIANSLQTAMESLGFEEKEFLPVDEQHIDILNRKQVIKWACLLGNRLCRRITVQKLQNFELLSADLKEVVACGGVRELAPVFYNRSFSKALISGDPSIISGFGCNKYRINVYNFLNTMIENNTFPFEAVYKSGSWGVNFVLDFLVNYWSSPEIMKYFLHRSESFFQSFAKYISTDGQIEKLRSIASMNTSMPKEIKRILMITIDSSSENVRFLKKHAVDVTNWIKEEINSGSSLRMSLCLFCVVLFFVFF